MPAIPDRNTPELLDCAGAGLRVHAHNVATVVCVSGEIDASNADRVGEAIRRFSRQKAPLILNLSQLDFLGIAGFRALITLNHEHQQAQPNEQLNRTVPNQRLQTRTVRYGCRL